MKRKIQGIFIVLVITVFASVSAAATVKYLPLTQFGISVQAKSLYAAKGKTANGAIVDATKARLNGLPGAVNGQRVTATYMGNGWVHVRNAATGEDVRIEIKEHIPYGK